MDIPKHISKDTSTPSSEAKHEQDSALERLIFFSDAIFAIAITLLALDIRLPALPPDVSDAELLKQLLDLSPKYYSFGISFLSIGLYWLGHHRMFRYIVRYDTVLLVLNLLLLLCIAFIPFPTTIIGDYSNRTAHVFYSLTLTLTGLISGGMWLYASVGGRLLASNMDQSSFAFGFLRAFFAPMLFLLSALVAWWSPSLSSVLWYAIAVIAVIIALLEHKTHK